MTRNNKLNLFGRPNSVAYFNHLKFWEYTRRNQYNNLGYIAWCKIIKCGHAISTKSFAWIAFSICRSLWNLRVVATQKLQCPLVQVDCCYYSGLSSMDHCWALILLGSSRSHIYEEARQENDMWWQVGWLISSLHIYRVNLKRYVKLQVEISGQYINVRPFIWIRVCGFSHMSRSYNLQFPHPIIYYDPPQDTVFTNSCLSLTSNWIIKKWNNGQRCWRTIRVL